MKQALLAAAFLLLCGAGAAHAQAPVADFFSTTSLVDGQQMLAGTTIEAWDSNGVRCGTAQVSATGGFMIHVYGDDPMTPGADEGARDGEMLTWRISGATVLNATWMSNLIGQFPDLRWENGAAKEIRLDGQATAIEEHSWSEIKARFRP
jgi:hypothetical protein